jgi:hypothetical protein
MHGDRTKRRRDRSSVFASIPWREHFEVEAFVAHLDSLGENAVRARVICKEFGKDGPRKAIADDWLRRKEEARKNRVALLMAVAAVLTAVAGLVGSITAPFLQNLGG